MLNVLFNILIINSRAHNCDDLSTVSVEKNNALLVKFEKLQTDYNTILQEIEQINAQASIEDEIVDDTDAALEDKNNVIKKLKQSIQNLTKNRNYHRNESQKHRLEIKALKETL